MFGSIADGEKYFGARAYIFAADLQMGMERVELIIASGGLGPTEDDLTRETVADLLGRKLHLNNEILRYIEGRFRQLGREMPAVNVRQAMVPEGAEVLENPRGSAPGLWIEDAGHFIALLPGPPRELKPMYQERVLPRLLRRSSKVRMFHRELRVAGLGESGVEQRIRPIHTRYTDVNTTWGTAIEPRSTLGQYQAASDPRQIQLGLKVDF